MPQERLPADALRAFRDILVARRRELVETLFEAREERGEEDAAYGAHRGLDVQRVQEQIEAVDRAISDEERLASP